MKSALRFAYPLCALVLIWLLLRDRPGHGQPSAGNIPETPAASAPPVPSNPAQILPPAPAPQAVPIPLPRTTSELNTFADGPRSLPEKMSVLTRMMREAAPEQAKAAAVRAVFIVKNAEFTAQLQPVIVAGDVKPEALEVLSLNLYDRPLDLLLPAWALIRERPGHPLYEAAADGLEFHLKEKAGFNGPQLAQVIRDYLNPGRR